MCSMSKKPKSGPLLQPIPLDFETAVKAFLATPPPPKEKKAAKPKKAKP